MKKIFDFIRVFRMSIDPKLDKRNGRSNVLCYLAPSGHMPYVALLGEDFVFTLECLAPSGPLPLPISFPSPNFLCVLCAPFAPLRLEILAIRNPRSAFRFPFSTLPFLFRVSRFAFRVVLSLPPSAFRLPPSSCFSLFPSLLFCPMKQESGSCL